ncbi:hypothetical protein [Nevskia soli]|uniref:hypothetical protein n=1 Tax=Nevskia soli TaxID=418856 RepID=UPI0004A77658|nr:hypothetical protein [Nevskia soli]
MTADEAIAFVEKHGVVLASGKGPVPRLAEAIADGPIKGSWWAHPKSHQIFRVFQALGESGDILVCRLVGGKITFVHRRLWPALVRVSDRFPARQLAQTCQEHTAAGHHVNRDTAFPQWVPPGVLRQAQQLGEQEALQALGAWAVDAHPVAPPDGFSRAAPGRL